MQTFKFVRHMLLGTTDFKLPSLLLGKKGPNYLKLVHTIPTIPASSISSREKSFLRDKKIIPHSDPPTTRDVNLLYDFFDQSTKLTVLTGAGISTEAGIPDYRSPNVAALG